MHKILERYFKRRNKFYLIINEEVCIINAQYFFINYNSADLSVFSSHSFLLLKRKITDYILRKLLRYKMLLSYEKKISKTGKA